MIFDGSISNVSCLYDIDRSGDGDGTGIWIINGYSGYIGLPETVTAGDQSYKEYRDTELIRNVQGAVKIDSQSSRLKINLGGSTQAVTIKATGSATTNGGEPALQLVGSGLTTVTIESGSVGLGYRSGQTTNITTLRQASGDVICGTDCTLTNIVKSSGSLRYEGATTSFRQDGGTTTIRGTGTQTAITNYKEGVINYEGTGTITAYTGNGSSKLNLDAAPLARTITNATLNDAAVLIDSTKTGTYTNPVQVYGELSNRIQAARQYNVTPV